MEIQDRNNIMQLALNLGFDNRAAATMPEMDFLNMLKQTPAPDQPKDEQIAKISLDSKKSFNKAKITAPIEKKTEKLVSQPQKTKTKAKVSIDDNSSDKAPSMPVDNKITDNQNSVAAENPVNTQDEVAVVETSEDNVVITPEDEPVDISATMVTPLDIIPLNSLVEELNYNDNIQSAAVITEASTPIINNTLPTDEITDTQFITGEEQELPVPEISEKKSDNQPQFQPEISAAVSEDEQIILQQAHHIDSITRHQKPLNIKVEVQEEKIADQLDKNVLQNSFTLTSMLQSADAEDVVELNNLLTPEEFIPDNDALPQDVVLPQTSETYIADGSLTAALSTSDDSAVITLARSAEVTTDVSGKFATQRLQEIDNNNNFKGLAKEVIDQIKVNITKSAVKGVDTIDIQLKPEDLGKIQIRMYINKDGHLRADIISSRQETANLLSQQVESLSKSFQDAGYDTDSRSFNFSFQNGNQANHHNEEQKLQQFIGSTLEQESEIVQANDNLIYDPKIGLNIRV